MALHGVKPATMPWFVRLVAGRRLIQLNLKFPLNPSIDVDGGMPAGYQITTIEGEQ
jgi:hypothetical protein